MTETRGQTLNAEITKMASDLINPVYLQDLRRQMIKFANLQLSNESLAEDVVQDALMGALKNAGSFTGRAALKTWVFAILKNKIADNLRQRQRSVEANHWVHRDEESEDFNELFDAKGYWQADERPAAWGDPEAAMHDQHFWQIFEACLENLPGLQGRVFMMREFIEMESHEICLAVDISQSNLNVMLHRARMRLRVCLENRWFNQGASSC